MTEDTTAPSIGNQPAGSEQAPRIEDIASRQADSLISDLERPAPAHPGDFSESTLTAPDIAPDPSPEQPAAIAAPSQPPTVDAPPARAWAAAETPAAQTPAAAADASAPLGEAPAPQGEAPAPQAWVENGPEAASSPGPESTPETPSTPDAVSAAEPPQTETVEGQTPSRPPERPREGNRVGPGQPGRGPNPGRPNPGRGGRPGRPGVVPPNRPHSAGASAHPSPTNVEAVVDPVDPHKWGRIDSDGVVYVYSVTGERPVGNWQAGDIDAGLAHFGRRFDDFVTEIALLETRLATGSGEPKATRAHAIELRESVDTMAAVGDFDSAAARLEVVIGAAEAAVAGASQARAAARTRAVAAKEALCAEAEQLAESTAWKTTGDRLKAIVEEWRTIHGIDRKTDDALWKRFAKARDTFTRHRGTHFADLDKQRVAAKDAKEELIARAEELSESNDWGKTAGEYRTLMEKWKASGRAPRDVEDQLWDRFRAAQEKFFSRRNKTFSERDTEFETNAAAKERLLAEAEKIDLAKGIEAARATLRSVHERWEAAGKVPRERIREFDSRLRVAEDRVKRAEDSHWRRTDPETAARLEQFRSRAEAYRSQAAKARSTGDERKALQAEAQAKQWEEWLAAAENAVDG